MHPSERVLPAAANLIELDGGQPLDTEPPGRRIDQLAPPRRTGRPPPLPIGAAPPRTSVDPLQIGEDVLDHEGACLSSPPLMDIDVT